MNQFENDKIIHNNLIFNSQFVTIYKFNINNHKESVNYNVNINKLTS